MLTSGIDMIKSEPHLYGNNKFGSSSFSGSMNYALNGAPSFEAMDEDDFEDEGGTAATAAAAIAVVEARQGMWSRKESSGGVSGKGKGKARVRESSPLVSDGRPRRKERPMVVRGVPG